MFTEYKELFFCFIYFECKFQSISKCIYSLSRSAELMYVLLCIDPDQLKHAAEAYPDEHISPPIEFPFQESLLCAYIPLRRNVSARISLRGVRRLIGVDTLRRGTAHLLY